MGALNLTIQVQNVDPTVTTAELEAYFSYCGTVDKIQLQRNKDESQSALVTFRQPFAFRTALLLDNALVGRQPIRVSPSKDSTNDLPSIKLESDTKDDQEHARLVPGVLRPNEAVTPGGATNILDRTRDKLEERYKLSEKGRLVVDQTRSAIHTAEKAAECFRSLLASNPYVAAGLVFLSGALYKAAMYASQVSARKKN
ncbi:uncharacterized protein LOC115673933 [Syzygium oleosum]|uniref:uncharacterized protein LOC115673933 n=1 Tax=Syzygium oleosum TaxID=219896 RepID=UPI0011D238FE|nr:uncharacterized protein LOC115673933 [Syzygium oleosum]